jgi:cytochrome c oxidase subunit 3
MLSALLIAMLTAITVWWLLIQRLKDKPWLKQGVLPTSQDTVTSSAPKVGLAVFLVVVTSLFGLFASAYYMRVDGHGGLASWVRLDEPNLLWVNTLILVLASAAMQVARNRIDAGMDARGRATQGAVADGDELKGGRAFFLGAGVLTIAFLAGQMLAWRQAQAQGDWGPDNPALAFFVLLTGIHGLHLVGGLWVLGRTTTRLFRGVEANTPVGRGRLRLSVQLCTTYWHWLLLIWLGLFALLLST